jgi:hypothetical protein
MRTKKVDVVLETGELSHGVPLTVTCQLVLHEDGTVTGSGTLTAPGLQEAFAATGRFMDSLAPARTQAATAH